MTEEQINEEPKSELDECKQKCDEYLNNWKRERADFINYKNDEIKRIGMLAQYTKEETLLKILPVVAEFGVVAIQTLIRLGFLLEKDIEDPTWGEIGKKKIEPSNLLEVFVKAIYSPEELSSEPSNNAL